MSITRRTLGRLTLAAASLLALPALAQDRPAPFDKPENVRIALVRDRKSVV